MAMAIHSPRLLVRPYTLDDVGEMHALLLGDTRAMAHIGGPLDLAAARAGIELSIDWNARKGLGFGPVVERAGGRMVGEAGLVPFGGEGPGIELGYAFAPAFWGRGYATEIGGALLDEAFGALGLDRVVAVTRASNSGSRHVLDKLGFTPAGRRHVWGLWQLLFVRDRQSGDPATRLLALPEDVHVDEE